MTDSPFPHPMAPAAAFQQEKGHRERHQKTNHRGYLRMETFLGPRHPPISRATSVSFLFGRVRDTLPV